MYSLSISKWLIAILSAFIVGLSKSGFTGAGILVVALFANIIPSTRASTGIVLPLLISADIVAVTVFRRHAVWKHLWRMFPWAAVGIVMGSIAMQHIDDRYMKLLIGATIIVLVVLQILQKRRQAKQEEIDIQDNLNHKIYVAIMGLLAGFTTMTANAAGPIMILYLLSMRLPKMEFIGTGAWFFLIVNLFKVPFSAAQHLINPQSLMFDGALAPFAVTGALGGRWLVTKINQTAFEIMALVFALIGGLNLLYQFIAAK